MQQENLYRKSRPWLYVGITVIILILILLLFLYLVRGPLIFRSGASTLDIPTTQINNTPNLSLDNSFVFASPLRANAVGGERIRITVYILDDRGIGIIGKKVIIGGGKGLQVTSVLPVTDNLGRATFDIASSGTPGVFLIQAAVDGVTLTQKATISFD